MSLFDKYNSSDSDNDADYVPECSSDEEQLPGVLHENNTKKSIKNAQSQEVASTDTEVSKTKVDEKKRAEDLFKDFLSECANEIKQREDECISGTAAFSLPISTKSSNDSPLSIVTKKDDDAKKKPVELLDFAGETVDVKKDGSVSVLTEPIAPNSEKPTVKRPVRSLESVLGNIIQNNKPKLNTLDKSLMDWKNYTKSEGIEEELKQHNQGKGGYIERQCFLQRSDLRSFEIEWDFRFSQRKNT